MRDEKSKYVDLQIASGVAAITINRPPLNILDIKLMQQIEESLDALTENNEVRVLQIRAAGKMFSAGVDIADHSEERVGEMIPLFNRVCQKIAEFPSPTIAVVQGHAMGGGCELVLCADLAVMASGAKIGQPEIQLAAFAPVAALRLPQIVGYRRAAQMLFTGYLLEAEEALAVGLINAVGDEDEMEDWVAEQSGKMASMSRAAQMLNKRALHMGYTDWTNSLAEMENLYLKELMKTADALEGMQAFQEKRAPHWKHE